MQGKLYVTIFGLLLFQALGGVLLSLKSGQVIVELTFAAIALIGAIAFLIAPSTNTLRFAAIIFALGTLNVLYLALTAITPWIILLLCMAAAGFLLSIDMLSTTRKRSQEPIPENQKHAALSQRFSPSFTKEVTGIVTYGDAPAEDQPAKKPRKARKTTKKRKTTK